jgi:hypothetical protein
MLPCRKPLLATQCDDDDEDEDEDEDEQALLILCSFPQTLASSTVQSSLYIVYTMDVCL